MITDKTIAVIGYGVVGRNLEAELKKLNCFVVDKYKDVLKIGNQSEKPEKYDIGFICVDTPLIQSTNTLDVSEVENAIAENDCEIYVIKSTCPVGTVERLSAETGKRIIFSPEYYGGTQHCNNFDFDFTILGGSKSDCVEVVQVMQEVYDGRHEFHIVESKVAEMAKFMENAWLAAKVSFCNQFQRACKQAGIHYEDLRELFVLDPRVNPSHTFVYEGKPYWDSHCLNKDVPAVAYQFDMELLKDIIKFNEKR